MTGTRQDEIIERAARLADDERDRAASAGALSGNPVQNGCWQAAVAIGVAIRALKARRAS